MNAEMRKHALWRYIVFRAKLMELLDFMVLWEGLRRNEFCPANPVGRVGSDFAGSLRTVVLSWFTILVDKSKDGMDAIALWTALFPKHKDDIEQLWKEIEVDWATLRLFRDRAGFHADKPIRFFAARIEIVKRNDTTTKALGKFRSLANTLLNAEAEELPDLEAAVDSMLDELEQQNRVQYNRDNFKLGLMLPNTRG